MGKTWACACCGAPQKHRASPPLLNGREGGVPGEGAASRLPGLGCYGNLGASWARIGCLGGVKIRGAGGNVGHMSCHFEFGVAAIIIMDIFSDVDVQKF